LATERFKVQITIFGLWENFAFLLPHMVPDTFSQYGEFCREPFILRRHLTQFRHQLLDNMVFLLRLIHDVLVFFFLVQCPDGGIDNLLFHGGVNFKFIKGRTHNLGPFSVVVGLLELLK
jgi:hypothetical protein